jgi:ankyrin repeat protein
LHSPLPQLPPVRSPSLDSLGLLDLPPPPAIAPQSGKTAFHWAARFSQLNLIDKLLAAGAHIEVKDDTVPVSHPLAARPRLTPLPLQPAAATSLAARSYVCKS